MRVLVLHSPYLSGAVSGENRVVVDEVRLLTEARHEVRIFLPERRPDRGAGRLREGVSAIWSVNAVQEVRRLVHGYKPDVVHVHNLFPALSPAVLRVVRGAGAALAMTLHNYRLLCLPATLLRDGQVCEDCLGRLPWRGVVHDCYRASLAGSAALGTSIGVHRALGTFDRVDLYLAVSDFVRTKHVEAGLPAERIVVKPNFAWPSQRREGPGEYFLFAGRLSSEKGVRILAEAWQDLELPLVVVGDGPEATQLRGVVTPFVEYRGAVRPDQIPGVLSRARALIVPSLWYEGAPRSILEAYAAGVPVIASSIGALKESVQHGVTGLLVPPGDPAALAVAARQVSCDADSRRLGEGAWRVWAERYTPAHALTGLEEAYRRARARREGLSSGAPFEPTRR